MEASFNQSYCAYHFDDTFGPYAGRCRGGFDFTRLFQESILTIPPLVFLLLAVPWRISHLYGRCKKVETTLMVPAKLIVLGAYTVLQLTLVILWATAGEYRTRASVATAVLGLLGAIALCLLSYLEHTRNTSTSFIATVYLFFSLLFDVVIVRTLWLNRLHDSLAIVLSVSISFKVVALVLESWEKDSILLGRYRDFPPEEKGNVFNRSVFWWLHTLLLNGFRKVISIEDLYPLDSKLYCEKSEAELMKRWNKSDKGKKHQLAYIIITAFKWPLIIGSFPRLAVIGLTFSQPFLINTAISVASAPEDTNENQQRGWGLIGAYFFVYFGIAIFGGQYMHNTNRMTVMMRGSLVAAIYEKTLHLSLTSADPNAAITLMSTDIERIAGGCTQLQETWANVIEVGIALWLLEIQLEVACVVPAVITILATIGTLSFTKKIGSKQTAWLVGIQTRVAATAKTLGDAKGLKQTGLTDTAFDILTRLRKQEITASRAFRKVMIAILLFSMATPVIAPVISFVAYALIAKAKDDQTLTIARAFTALSLFELLTGPLTALFSSIPALVGAAACCTRIQEYLSKPGFNDEDSRNETAHAPLVLSEKSLSHTGRDTTSTLAIHSSVEETNDLYRSSSRPYVATLRNVSAGWSTEAEPLLQDVNIDIPHGSVTLIVGPTGCGKSTLLKALLGELPKVEGSVQFDRSSIAFCDQTPWIPNGSVREVVLGCTDFEDSEWYRTVLKICSLDEDIKHWPNGDQTPVGSKGMMMSGGQKKRLSLARALYTRRDVLILDDALSELDASTENSVFHQLLGMLDTSSRRRRTIVLATSMTHRIPYATHIVVIGADGKVAQQGSFSELQSTEGYIKDLSLPEPRYEAVVRNPSHNRISSADFDLSSYIVTAFQSGLSDSSLTLVQPEARSIESEEASRGDGDRTIYAYYFNSFGLSLSLSFLVLTGAYTFCTAFPSVWIKWWAESNADDPNSDLGRWLGVYGALGVASIGFLVAACWTVFLIIIPKSALHFHGILLRTVARAPLSFLTTVDAGVTLNRFSQDLMVVDMELPNAALSTVLALVHCVGQIILISVAAKYIAIAFPFCILVFYLLQKFYLRTSRQLRLMDLESKSSLYSQFTETINGLATIRAFNWGRACHSKNCRFLDTSQKPYYLLLSVQRWLNFTVDMIIAFIAIILITMAVELRNVVSPGFMGIALLNIMTFSGSVKAVLHSWTSLETSIGAINRIKSFSSETGSEERSDASHPPDDWPSNGHLEIKGLTASYKGHQPVLKNVSIEAQPGQKVGICGRTGSGKSSLILSIYQMLPADQGSVLIDGMDLSTLAVEDVRSRLTIVSQDPFTLLGTIRFNLDPLSRSTDDVIIQALDKVGLWAPIEVRGGLDQNVDMLGLSQGEKQLFCFARAMVQGSKFLFLDEAASSLDSVSDDLIDRLVATEFRGCTIVTIAHKVNSLMSYDKVYVLDQGVVLESGSPVDLADRPGSAFRKLVEAAS